jgi:hypothetical protein
MGDRTGRKLGATPGFGKADAQPILNHVSCAGRIGRVRKFGPVKPPKSANGGARTGHCLAFIR